MTVVPTELRSMWVAAPRTIPGLLASYRYRFELTEDTFRFPLDNLADGQLQATASIVDANVLRLTSTDTSSGCQRR